MDPFGHGWKRLLKDSKKKSVNTRYQGGPTIKDLNVYDPEGPSPYPDYFKFGGIIQAMVDQLSSDDNLAAYLEEMEFIPWFGSFEEYVYASNREDKPSASKQINWDKSVWLDNSPTQHVNTSSVLPPKGDNEKWQVIIYYEPMKKMGKRWLQCEVVYSLAYILSRAKNEEYGTLSDRGIIPIAAYLLTPPIIRQANCPNQEVLIDLLNKDLKDYMAGRNYGHGEFIEARTFIKVHFAIY